MSERSTVLLLQDILEAINNIFEFTRNISFEQYSNDIKTKHAVEYNFMIIGEAVTRIPTEFKEQHSQINWRQVKDFRNIIVHDSFGIDDNIVWDIISLNLQDLFNQIATLAKEGK